MTKNIFTLQRQSYYIWLREPGQVSLLSYFLCTRVQCAKVQDKEKLERVLGYLKWSEDQVLLLWACVVGEIVAYVDAAYAMYK
jgi:hypothetical protein